jgi:hypothetical protein
MKSCTRVKLHYICISCKMEEMFLGKKIISISIQRWLAERDQLSTMYRLHFIEAVENLTTLNLNTALRSYYCCVSNYIILKIYACFATLPHIQTTFFNLMADHSVYFMILSVKSTAVLYFSTSRINTTLINMSSIPQHYILSTIHVHFIPNWISEFTFSR